MSKSSALESNLQTDSHLHPEAAYTPLDPRKSWTRVDGWDSPWALRGSWRTDQDNKQSEKAEIKPIILEEDEEELGSSEEAREQIWEATSYSKGGDKRIQENIQNIPEIHLW